MPLFDVTTNVEEITLLGNASVTVSVVSGDTLYYSDSMPVTSAINQGSLTAGGTPATFTEPIYVRSAGRSSVQTTYITALQTSVLQDQVNTLQANLNSTNAQVSALSAAVAGGGGGGGGTSILAQFNISGLLTQWVGSAASNSATLNVTGHDFQVGHGIRIMGGTNSVPTGLTPGAPTVTATGSTGSTAYQYQAALVANAGTEYVTAAGVATAIANGNATLSDTNYNLVRFAHTGTTRTAYAIYGRQSGSMRFLALIWYVPPATFTVASNATRPAYVNETNLAPSTLYTYAVTGVSWQGNETQQLASGSVTTGTTGAVHPVDVVWTLSGNVYYQSLNIYRNGLLIATVPSTDKAWEDNGSAVPGAQTLPTAMSYKDVGSTVPTAPVGVPWYVPATPPASAIRAALVTTVSAITTDTVTLTQGVGGAGVTSQTVMHDDTPGIQAALTANKTVELPAGYYNNWGVTVPAGGALNGQRSGWGAPVTVTASSNPLPSSARATLCNRSLVNNGVFLNGAGAACRGIQMFWPEQTNSIASANSGATNSFANLIPYPPGISNGQNIGFLVEDIVDCNSYIGTWIGTGGTGKITGIQTAVTLWGVFCEGPEATITDIRGNPADTYCGNTDSPRIPNISSAVRGVANMPIISHLFVDRACQIWWTCGTSAGGTLEGFEGLIVDDIGQDDWPFSLIVDCPVSAPYGSSGSGLQFRHTISNVNVQPGGGQVKITVPDTEVPYTPGANAAVVQIDNCDMASTLALNGRMNVLLANSFISGGILCRPSSLLTATPLMRIQVANCLWNNARFVVDGSDGGRVKAYVSTSACENIGQAVSDSTANGGLLYVIDEQSKRTARFSIPQGTSLTAATPITVGNIVLPQSGHWTSNTQNFIYVISASGNGNSATDTWSINTTGLTPLSGTGALFTTSLQSFFGGAGGEGTGEQDLALFSVANPAGAGITVLPIVFTPAGTGSAARPLECEITYCVSPLNA